MTNDKQRERLVELLKETRCERSCDGFKNIEVCNGCTAYERYAESADRILADGWLRPPVKVGDVVWYINQDEKIDNAQVACIDCRNTGNHIIIHKYIYGAEEIIKICVRFEEFGKTVFLTKEEAEQALKGVKKMIIYEYSTWGAYKSENGLFGVTEIEVEEKPKSYVGKHTRINKSDINNLQTSYGNRMFRLDADEQAYISAMIEVRKMKIASIENSLNILKAELKKWEALGGVCRGETRQKNYCRT